MYKSFINGLILAVLLTATLLQAATPVFAATSIRLYLNPGSRTVTNGTAFAVQMRLSKNDNTFVKHVRASLNFPADKLAVSSISSAGSYFIVPEGVGATYNNSTGTVTYEGGNDDSANAGDFLVATINFVTKSPGTAGVIFNGQSRATFTSNGENRLTGTTGGTYTISSPPAPPPPPGPSPPPPPGPSPSPPPAGNPVIPPILSIPAPASPLSPGGIRPAPGAPTSTPANPPPGTAPDTEDINNEYSPESGPVFQVSNIQVTEVTSSSAIISWETAQGTTGTAISYGTDAKNLRNVRQAGDPLSDVRIKIDKLPSGKTIYYEITAVDGSQQAVHKGSFKTVNGPFWASNLFRGFMILTGLILLLGLLFFLFRKNHHRRHAKSGLSPALQNTRAPSPSEASAILSAVATSHKKQTAKISSPAPSPPPPKIMPLPPPQLPHIDPAISKFAPIPESVTNIEPQPQSSAHKHEKSSVPAPPNVPVLPPATTPEPIPYTGKASTSANPSTHWPWTAEGQTTPAGAAATKSKLQEYKDEPDMFELGEARLKQEEAELAKKNPK